MILRLSKNLSHLSAVYLSEAKNPNPKIKHQKYNFNLISYQNSIRYIQPWSRKNNWAALFLKSIYKPVKSHHDFHTDVLRLLPLRLWDLHLLLFSHFWKPQSSILKGNLPQKSSWEHYSQTLLKDLGRHFKECYKRTSW